MQDIPYFDALIIGAGVVGCSIARELARSSGRFAVLEAAPDVCTGTTAANSAIVHAGFDAKPHSRMAEMNVLGNAQFDELAADLGFSFSRIGSLVVSNSASQAGLQGLQRRGEQNGVPKLSILDRDTLLQLEPNIADDAQAALFAPTAGICDPFEMTFALAENAAANGVQFYMNQRVLNIESLCRENQTLWFVKTQDSSYYARAVINAAGMYADDIHNMVCEDKLHIHARRGQYLLLDNTVGTYVHHTIFMLPTAMGKGVLVTPTVHGNLLVGPTAEDIDDKTGTETTAEGLDLLKQKSALTVKDIPFGEVITNFSGLRAHLEQHDFVLGEQESACAAGFFDAAGIESPGLTSAPAIGRVLAEEVSSKLELSSNLHFNPKRKPFVKLRSIDYDSWSQLIAKDCAYGHIICRCMRVSEAQIKDAIHRVPGATTVDGVKRRVYPTMGRCQGSFCSAKLLELLAQELEVSPEEIHKMTQDSRYTMGPIKQKL